MNPLFRTRMPHQFPREVTMVLQRGDAERAQCWSHYEHRGVRHKLVIDRHTCTQVRAGEEWIVEPLGSPNGHVIICNPLRRLKESSESKERTSPRTAPARPKTAAPRYGDLPRFLTSFMPSEGEDEERLAASRFADCD